MISTARRALRIWSAFRRHAAAGPRRIDVGVGLGDWHIDHVLIHSDGTVATEGWAGHLDAFRQSLSLQIGDRRLLPTHVYRVNRPDVATLLTKQSTFAGAVAEWTLGSPESEAKATLLNGPTPIAHFVLPAIVEPAYEHLRTEARVLGREHIYGYGPPVHEVSREIVDLARTLPSPILDFGCGAGALLRELRREGREAYGLELDTQRIHDYLLDEVRPFVTLYDGRLPTSFRAGEFASVVCSEVLEHIPGVHDAFNEIVRVARQAVLITVPDMSAIPRSFHHGVVPWHLLESTHVNFFTQRSLEGMLAAHAADVEVTRIGLVRCDRLQYYTSLAAIAKLQ